MIFRLEMPFVDPGVHWVRVVRWWKAVGELVTYGDDVCEVAVEERARLDRAHANRLEPDRRHVAGDGATYGTRALDYRLRVVASDSGYLREVTVAEGAPAEIGAVLALLSSEAGESLDNDRPRPGFRVVSDMIDEQREA